MGLRSRKIRADGTFLPRLDCENQILRNADAPLKQMHIQAEALNFMWRGLIFKLTIALVFLSLVTLWNHRDNVDDAIFSGISIVHYILSARWLYGISDSNYAFADFTRNIYFRGAFAIVAFQLLLLAFSYYEIDGSSYANHFPISALHFPLVTGFLLYMRGNVKMFEQNRKELAKIGRHD